MPIYEYQCAACGHSLDALQKISDPVLTECPACGKQSLEKQVSATSFQLKGTGWYATDFRNNSAKKQETTKPETTETKTEAKTETKTETAKPDKTTDTSGT